MAGKPSTELTMILNGVRFRSELNTSKPPIHNILACGLEVQVMAKEKRL